MTAPGRYNIGMEEEKDQQADALSAAAPAQAARRTRFAKLADGRLLDKATGLVFDDIQQFRTVNKIGAEIRAAEEKARKAAKKRRKEQKAARKTTRRRRK